MSDRELRGGIPDGIQRINFEGFVSAWVMVHEDGSYRIGVHIPRLMPDNSPVEKGTKYTKDEEIPIDDSVVENEEKPPLSKKIKKCNYIWVNPLYWARKSYKTLHGKVTDKPERSRKVAALATPMLDPSTPSKQVEPHIRNNRERQSFGNVVISGAVRLSGNVNEPNHSSEDNNNIPENYHATMDSINCDVLTANKFEIGQSLGTQALHDEFSEHNRTHLWEETIDEVWDVPQPKIGENIIVIFLDGDIQKGYYLPFSP